MLGFISTKTLPLIKNFIHNKGVTFIRNCSRRVLLGSAFGMIEEKVTFLSCQNTLQNEPPRSKLRGIIKLNPEWVKQARDYFVKFLRVTVSL